MARHAFLLLPLLHHLCRLHRNSGAIAPLLRRLYRNSGATVVIAVQAVQVWLVITSNKSSSASEPRDRCTGPEPQRGRSG